MHFKSTQHTKNSVPSESLIMIQASALPGMSHVISVTGNRLNCLVDIQKPGTTIHKNREESLRSEWRTCCFHPWSSKWFSELVYTFHSSSTDCIWTYLPWHPDKPALPQNLNIRVWLKVNQLLRKYQWYVQSAPNFVAQGLHLPSSNCKWTT
jgi:hypothetical protein